VPLEVYYYLDQGLHLVIDHNGQQVADFPHTGGEVRRQMFRRALTREQRREAEQAEPQPWEIINSLSSRAMLPAIYFLFSRRDCEEFAQRLAVMRLGLLKDPEAIRRIDEVIENYLGGLRPEDRDLEQVQEIVSLARKGIGFHHAGLLPILKQLVETLFGQGLMQVVFATETLALGVNMPARTVIIGRMSKWDGRRRRPLIPNEFQQMAGRAGRRGMDIKGNVIVPYSLWISFHETLDIVTGELEPVRSAFAIRYNTVLNLWDPPHGNRVRQMLQQSLTQFQTARRVRDIEDEIVQVGRRIEAIPQDCLIGLDGGDALLDEYHGLNSSLTALRGKERRVTRDLSALAASVDDRPWPEPGRQALRRLFKTSEPGTVVHLRSGGWAVYLGRGTGGGVGLFLVDHRVIMVNEYRQIDYLPAPSQPVTLPAPLCGLERPVDDVGVLLTPEELAAIWEQVRALDLPDLDAAAQEHRQKVEAQIGPERMSLEQERQDLNQQISLLSQAQLQHPCRACPRRKEHHSYRKAIAVLEQERAALEVDLGRELTSEEERIRGIIRGIRTVLHRFDYLHRGYPTAKADTLADVFDTNGLIICEMLDRGILQDLLAADVAEAFSWFAYDRDFRFTNRYTLPIHLIHLKQRLQDIEQQVLAAERRNNLFISTGHNDAFYGAMRAWCLGATMAQILDRMELSEGDLVLTFNKTIDLMRQVREMLAHAMPNHPLRDMLAAAEELVRRDIVEQSLTIGFLPLGGRSPVPDDEAIIVEGA
jgi:ATP-dependent RNA helicase HelY